jgi:hypothetical protein
MHDLADILAPVISGLLRLQLVALAAVVGFFFGIALRQLLFVAWVDRGRSFGITLLRLLAAFLFGEAATLCVQALGPGQTWGKGAVLAGAAGAALALIEVFVLGIRKLRPGHPPLLGWLLRIILVLGSLLVILLTLMRAGFLNLTTDQPVLIVEVTGETATKMVRWAPPDQPLREQELRTSHVRLRTPAGQPVGEAWIYGDQVAINGRVLRLSPLLNAAGLSNLFALDFVHNGYFTADRHNTMPHQAMPLVPIGQLAVHPRWRSLQDSLLSLWERRTSEDSSFLIRAATTESTYFPLVAPPPSGKPLTHTYILVLTPGGLTSK